MTDDATPGDVVVARLGRPHGIRGELSIEVRTDQPDLRFIEGARFGTDPDIGPLTVATVRDHNGTLLLSFQEIADRTAAENARNVLLVAPPLSEEEDPDAWYDQQLVGLSAHLPDGREVGTVVGVEHGAAQDLLVIAEPGHGHVRLPFVTALVPVVDMEAGRITVTPPGGLFTAVPEATE